MFLCYLTIRWGLGRAKPAPKHWLVPRSEAQSASERGTKECDLGGRKPSKPPKIVKLKPQVLKHALRKEDLERRCLPKASSRLGATCVGRRGPSTCGGGWLRF